MKKLLIRHEAILITIGVIAINIVLLVASCRSVAQEHGGQTLMRLARRSKPNLVVTPSIMPPTNTVVKQWSFAAVPHTNVPPPRLSTLQWEIIEYPGWPTIAGGGTQVVFFATWLERATKLPSTNWVKVSVALTPQRTNRATITNVWPQYIRAVHGWRVTP